MIIIWKSSIKTTSHFVSGIAPGTLVTDGTDVLVRTGDGHIQLEEIQFKLTINAFPSDPIGFKKTKEIWKLEGVLDDTSEERL